MSAAIVFPEIEVSSEVLELAAKLGVTAYLPAVLELTRTVFPDARVDAEAYQDHELADEWWIVFVVRHSIENPVEQVSVESNWHQRLFDCCPAHLASAFSIDTSYRP